MPLMVRTRRSLKSCGWYKPSSIGEQGIEGAAHFDQAATGFILTGQAVDLKAEHQTDMAQSDLGQEPGEIVAACRGRAGAALIAVENANAFGRPTPGRSALSEIGLNLSGFAVLLHLLRVRLADIDDGPAFEVLPLNLRGTSGRRINGIHWPPPFGPRRLERGGFAAPSASAGRIGIAEVRASGSAKVAASRCVRLLAGAGALVVEVWVSA